MSSLQLSEPDVRSLVRLLVEVSASRGESVEKKRLLMDGLLRLVSGDCWLWAWAPALPESQPPTYTAHSRGGFDEERYARFRLAAAHPEARRMAGVGLDELRAGREPLTRSCRHLSRNGLRQGPAAKLWQAADIGEAMCSMRALDSGGLSTVAIYRGVAGESFSPRDIRIAHVLLTECGWLHEDGWSEDSTPKVSPRLSPRRRMVLDLMLQGLPRKDMAGILGISVHTLDGYAKDIFRHFKAHSQAELIARFRSGDGRDTPISGD